MIVSSAPLGESEARARRARSLLVAGHGRRHHHPARDQRDRADQRPERHGRLPRVAAAHPPGSAAGTSSRVRSTSSAIAATSSSTRVVAHLVAETLPELERERFAAQVVAVVVQQERLRVQRLDAERRVGAHVDRGPMTAARELGHARRRSPAPGAGAAATSGGSPWGSRAPCRGRDRRRPRRPGRTAAPARCAATRDRRPRARRGPTTTRPWLRRTSTSSTPSAVSPNGAPSSGRLSIVPAARCPNVKFLPITACTPCTPFTRTRSTNPSAGICENSFVNDSTSSSSIPVASISDARRSTVVSSRGSLPGVSTSRGCRSNVTATERTPRSRAASTVRANTARWPRCTPSKNPTVTTDGPSGNGSRSIPSTIRMRASVSRTSSDGAVASRSHEDGPGRYGAPVGRARARTTMVLLLCLPLTLFACGGQASDPVTSVLDDDAITVGSFNFPESEVLAEIYAQTLEARGFRVQREFNVGPRELLIPALQRGLVELVPEYAGSLLGFFGVTASSDADHHASGAHGRARSPGTHGPGRRPGRGPQLVRDLRDHGGEPQRGAVERPHLVRAGDDVRGPGGMRAAAVLSQGTGGRVRPAFQGVHRARRRRPADRPGAQRRDDRHRSAVLERPGPAGRRARGPPRRPRPAAVGEHHAGRLAARARDVRPASSPMR